MRSVKIAVISSRLSGFVTPVLMGSVISTHEIALGWNSVLADNYVLERAEISDFSDAVIIYSGGSLFLNDDALTLGTTYYYRLKAQKSGFPDTGYSTLTRTTTVSNIYVGDPLKTIGDSFTYGQAATSGNSYPELLQDFIGGTLDNKGVGGSGVYKATLTFNQEVNQNIFGVLVIYIGFNDFRRSGVNSSTLTKVKVAHEMMLINSFAKQYYFYGDFTLLSGSISSLGFANIKSPMGYNPGYGSEGYHLSITKPGKAFGFVFVGGTIDYLYGSVEIIIDSVSIGIINLNNCTDGINDGTNDNKTQPYGFAVFGLSSGNHIIELISTVDLCPFNYMVELLDPVNDYCSTVLVMQPSLNPPEGWATSPSNGSDAISEAHSANIEEVVNKFKAEGYPVAFVGNRNLDVTTPVATNLDFAAADPVHPTNAGHLKIANNLISYIGLNAENRVFPTLKDIVFANGFYQSKNDSPWQAYGLSKKYLPASTDGSVEVLVANLIDADFGIMGLNSSNTNQDYNGYEYGAALYLGSIYKLLNGAAFASVLAGPLAVNSKMRFGRFGGNIKIQYAADGSTFSDVHNFGADSGVFYLNICLYSGKKAYNVILSGGFVDIP